MTAVLIDLAISGRNQWTMRLTPVGRNARSNPRALEADRSGAGPTALLLEDCEYVYEIGGGDPEEPVRIQPEGMFSPDDPGVGRRGRLRVARSVGLISVSVASASGDVVGRAELEVRSRKLDYDSEYRWMLERLASTAHELIQQRFADAEGRDVSDLLTPGRTAYQRLAYLSSFVRSGDFDQSLAQILASPHIVYGAEQRLVPAARGATGSSQFIRRLSRPGQRTPWPTSPSPHVGSLPVLVDVEHKRPSRSTPPNLSIKAILQSWVRLLDQVEGVLTAVEEPSAPERRGLAEVSRLRQRFSSALDSPFFRPLPDRVHVSHDNITLHRRAGYREFYAAHIRSESSGALPAEVVEEEYRSGRRDVAALYEMWCFIELVHIVSGLPGVEADLAPLLQESKHGLTLGLRLGKASRLHCDALRRGRRLRLELWANRSFTNGAKPDSSWSLRMKPDCSMRIASEDQGPLGFSVWLHFDAKYRLDEAPLDDGTPSSDSPLNADIVKMHAYHDAIRRSVGSYVLYPGADTERATHRAYQEVVPGVGAFPLRPTEGGQASSASRTALSRFIDDVLNHAAAQGTGMERARYWTAKAYQQPSEVPRFLDVNKPPADSSVLLGYVRSPGHLAWIEQTGLYNMRAEGSRYGSIGLDGAEATADLALLYSPGLGLSRMVRVLPGIVTMTSGELVAAGYPSTPTAEVYLCVRLAAQELSLGGADVAPETVDRLASLTADRRRRPVVVPLDRLWSET